MGIEFSVPYHEKEVDSMHGIIEWELPYEKDLLAVCICENYAISRAK